MTEDQTALARICLQGAEHDTMTFPEVVGALSQAGFESYSVDFRLGRAVYFRPEGDSVELATHEDGDRVQPSFDPAALQAAIRETQTQAPGYSYLGFRGKAKAAGCAGYIVSFTGRRAVYFDRTGETHVEFFPPAQ